MANPYLTSNLALSQSFEDLLSVKQGDQVIFHYEATVYVCSEDTKWMSRNMFIKQQYNTLKWMKKQIFF